MKLLTQVTRHFRLTLRESCQQYGNLNRRHCFGGFIRMNLENMD